ncbi:unnamed protein product, partial [Mesorhabditis belari]|uniref:BZIP domain-containing protein n=1 Tax=Mesorhabditis belari TaxID=2138241 RepID=A0AAF3JB71_9BILA
MDVEDGIGVYPDEMRDLLDSIDPTFLQDICATDVDGFFPSPPLTDSDGSVNGRRDSTASSSGWSNEEQRNCQMNGYQQNQIKSQPPLVLNDVFPSHDNNHNYPYSYEFVDEPLHPFPSPVESCPSVSPTRISSPSTSQSTYVFQEIPVVHQKLKQQIVLTAPKNVEPLRVILGKPVTITNGTTVSSCLTAQPISLIPQTRTLSAEEQRKIRNRHFAQQSREKKKKAQLQKDEELMRVTNENEQLRKENVRLRAENAELRARCGLASLEAPNLNAKGVRAMRAMAGGTIFVFALVFTAGIISTPFGAPSGEFKPESPSRTLKVDEKFVKTVETLQTVFNQSANSTDFQILGNMLDTWVSRHSAANGGVVRFGSTQRLLVNETGVMPRTSSGERKRETARQKAIRDRAWKHLDLINSNSTGSSIIKNHPGSPKMANLSYETPRFVEHSLPPRIDAELYTNLARAVQRRKDTLYLFGGQYLLMPSDMRDPLTQPRLSLIVPALAPNATGGDPIVSMLRIDCNVQATSLFNIPREYILF